MIVANNPKMVEGRAKAVELVEAGSSVRSAARQAGVSQSTARRALAELGRASDALLKAEGFELDDVDAGIKVLHSGLLVRVAERMARDSDHAKASELRDLAVSLGILDDKIHDRGVGGASVNVTQATQIIVKSEWPEP